MDNHKKKMLNINTAHMTMQTIKKFIDIHAPKERVWHVLLDDNFTRAWYAHFSEGTHAETDWKEGSKATFTDNSHSGLIGKIIANKACEQLSIEYTGIVTNGDEDYDSDMAEGVKGGLETYTLSQNGDVTHLSIECDMASDYFETMSLQWGNALRKIKELSESVRDVY